MTSVRFFEGENQFRKWIYVEKTRITHIFPENRTNKDFCDVKDSKDESKLGCGHAFFLGLGGIMRLIKFCGEF